MVNRDIFSAYLSRFVHDESLLIVDAASQYPVMEPLLVEGWEEYRKTASKVSESEIRNSHVSAEQFSTGGLSPESATSQIVNKDVREREGVRSALSVSAGQKAGSNA